jgi:aryl-alcohol dehydrogenase-like predicted oxidoreductase
VNRLALGTVQFGLSYGIANQVGQVSRLEAKAMLQLAAENGIDTLDTAIAYGESEICLGEVGTRGYKLVTKLPSVPEGCLDINGWVKKQMAASFSRLDVTTVYGLLLHRSEQLLNHNGKEIFEALESLKNSGRVEKIGVSIYAPSELDAISKLFHLDLVQAPFNLVDRRLLTSGWLHRLKSEGVEIHARSVFLQGLLLMPQAAIPVRFAPWNELWHTWHQWLTDNDISPVQACLACPLSFPEIDRVIVGADSASQLAQIISSANRVQQVNLPQLHCEDENLINPANWPKL